MLPLLLNYLNFVSATSRLVKSGVRGGNGVLGARSGADGRSGSSMWLCFI